MNYIAPQGRLDGIAPHAMTREMRRCVGTASSKPSQKARRSYSALPSHLMCGARRRNLCRERQTPSIHLTQTATTEPSTLHTGSVLPDGLPPEMTALVPQGHPKFRPTSAESPSVPCASAMAAVPMLFALQFGTRTELEGAAADIPIADTYGQHPINWEEPHPCVMSPPAASQSPEAKGQC